MFKTNYEQVDEKTEVKANAKYTSHLYKTTMWLIILCAHMGFQRLINKRFKSGIAMFVISTAIGTLVNTQQVSIYVLYPIYLFWFMELFLFFSKRFKNGAGQIITSAKNIEN